MTPAIGATFAGVTFPFWDSYARGRDIATFTWDFEKALGVRYFFAQPLKVRALLDIMFPR